MTGKLPKNEPLEITFLEKSVIVRFTNAKERNPLSLAVVKELHELLDEFQTKSGVEKIIFTGSENIFASGANLREIAALKKENAGKFARRGQSLMNKIANGSKLTIAAVNGYCFGGALDLALACQKRIASPSAVFCHPGANLGIMTGWGGTQRLPRLVGEAAALEMFFTAKQISAKEALKIGLIDEISENPLEESLANH